MSPSEARAVEFLRAARWPDGVRCPRCDSAEVGELKTRQLFSCRDCRTQFSLRVGTIFEDSPLPLSAWLAVIEAVATEADPSSSALARALGITQKTAWLALHRVRLAMRCPSFRGQEEPTGGKAFDALARKLVQVPKKELRRAEKRYKARKARRKKS